MREDGGGAVAERLTAIWTDVVGRPPPSPEANFFVDGGNSLAAMKFMARARKVYGSQLRLREIFDHPSIAAMTARLAELNDADAPLTPEADMPVAQGERR
ncbi:MAG: phosphopantetheine-binding protein [Jatrophihabitantaceae bacterium]